MHVSSTWKRRRASSRGKNMLNSLLLHFHAIRRAIKSIYCLLVLLADSLMRFSFMHLLYNDSIHYSTSRNSRHGTDGSIIPRTAASQLSRFFFFFLFFRENKINK